MKLRNKKTGEIIETNFDLSISIPDDEKLYGCDTYTQLKGYTSIAELNEEWEDVPEEPKEYWYIDYDGGILCGESNNSSAEKMMKSMGNHFESIEQAEQAVEKLKAWKRLKDKGFKFVDFARINDCACIIRATSDESWSEIYDDLNICFGGEE